MNFFFILFVYGFSIYLSYWNDCDFFFLNCIIFISSIFLHFSISHRLKIGFLILELIIILLTEGSFLEFSKMEILLNVILFLMRFFSYHYYNNTLNFKFYFFWDFLVNCFFSLNLKVLILIFFRISPFILHFRKLIRYLWILRLFIFFCFSYFFLFLNSIDRIIYIFYLYFLKFLKERRRGKKI